MHLADVPRYVSVNVHVHVYISLWSLRVYAYAYMFTNLHSMVILYSLIMCTIETSAVYLSMHTFVIFA